MIHWLCFKIFTIRESFSELRLGNLMILSRRSTGVGYVLEVL